MTFHLSMMRKSSLPRRDSDTTTLKSDHIINNNRILASSNDTSSDNNSLIHTHRLGSPAKPNSQLANSTETTGHRSRSASIKFLNTSTAESLKMALGSPRRPSVDSLISAMNSPPISTTITTTYDKSGSGYSKKKRHRKIKSISSNIVNKKLGVFLAEQNLAQPIKLTSTSSESVIISVANSNNTIFLPPNLSASFNYEDEEVGENEVVSGTERLSNDSNEASTSSSSVGIGDFDFKSPNYSTSRVDSSTPIPHTFAIVVEVNNPVVLSQIRADFSSLVDIKWPNGLPHDRTCFNEKFKLGDESWKLNFHDPDFFVSTVNTNDTKQKRSDDEHEHFRKYKLVSNDELMGGLDSLKNRASMADLELYPVVSSHSIRRNSNRMRAKSEADSIDMSSINNEQGETFEEGVYVFLLPILFPENIPASVSTPYGKLVHSLNINLTRYNKLNLRKQLTAVHKLVMVRTPPSVSNSTANKPIYVNRIWNKSLGYEISFPRKYIPIGGEHCISLKLTPLMKNLSVKRIKVNILERTVYTSKNLEYEWEYDGVNFNTSIAPDPAEKDKRAKERVVQLCEIRTKTKTNSSVIREEIVDCLNGNLLSPCYDKEQRRGEREEVIISNPVQISLPLPFLTSLSTNNWNLDPNHHFNGAPPAISIYGSSPFSDFSNSSFSPVGSPQFHSTSPVIGSLGTIISAGNKPIKSYNRDNGLYASSYNSSNKVLYPDSNLKFIKISHRLQVGFRISKPDEKRPGKLHHYEVMIDTPIVLLSHLCDEDSLSLPRYDDDTRHKSSYLGSSTHDPAPDIDDLNYSSPPPNQGIVFKTPDFAGPSSMAGNKFQIRPIFNDEDDIDYDVDQPPTFEEATSPIQIPHRDSLNISEMSFLSPTTTRGSPLSGSVSGAFGLSTLSLAGETEAFGNIDRMVDISKRSDSIVSGGSRDTSGIRSSLSHSFPARGSISAQSLLDGNGSQVANKERESREEQAAGNAAIDIEQDDDVGGDDNEVSSIHSSIMPTSSNDMDDREVFRKRVMDKDPPSYGQALPLMSNASLNSSRTDNVSLLTQSLAGQKNKKQGTPQEDDDYEEDMDDDEALSVLGADYNTDIGTTDVFEFLQR